MYTNTSIFKSIIMASLFWNSLTQDTDDFTQTLENHKNTSKISITISYGYNKNQSFFSNNNNEGEDEYEYDISQDIYEEIQDIDYWSRQLRSFTNSITKRIDNYYKNHHNTALLSYLYDREEDVLFEDNTKGEDVIEIIEEIEEIEA